MRFTKMHGLGNNYIYVDLWQEEIPEDALSPLAIAVADVNRGIGSDGLITIGPSTVADAQMRIFNADGSESQNCGNGIRCVGKYLYDHALTKATAITVETKAGIMKLDLHIGSSDLVSAVTVDMGPARLRRADLPVLSGAPDETALRDELTVNGETLQFTGVSMGNPHAIFFVEDAKTHPVEVYGPRVERHELFPERVNVEFVTMKNRREIDFRVWERGSGVTQACGTGACAAVVAACLHHVCDREEDITVHLLGGDLLIRYNHDGHVYMTGPAEEICTGNWPHEPWRA